MILAQQNVLPVIFVSHAYEDVRTGPAVYARHLWEYFAESSEIEFHIVAPDGPEGHPRFHVARASRPGAYAFYDALIKQAQLLAGRFSRPGILHMNAPHYAIVNPASSWKLWLQLNDYEGPQLLNHPWDSLLANGPRRFGSLLMRRWVERRMLRRCDLALANSDYTRREVLSSYSEVNPAQVITLYKGVDLSFFNSVKTRLKVAGACQFAFVGSNFRIKQLHLVVEAYANLKAPNCSLRIAGCTLEEFIKEYPQLAKAARSPGVIFHGRLDRASVRDLLLRSDSLLLPSRQEALGVAALEAIACGCRVIGARVGGIPEIIVGDEVGRLVDQPSVDAWREAMVAEVAVASPMGLHRSLLLERFSAQHMLAELRHLYLNCNFK